jgi:hypothetical protein
MSERHELDATAKGLPPGVDYHVEQVVPADGRAPYYMAFVGSLQHGGTAGRGLTDKEALQEAVDAFWAAWDRGEMGRPKSGG